MTANHDECDADEEWISLDTAENIQPIIQSTTVNLIKNLQPDESVESDCLHGFRRPGGEDLLACEIENKGNDKLENGLTEYHFPHVK